MKGGTFKRKLPSGRISWGYVIYAGRGEDGKRKQIFKSGYTTKGEADTALRNKLKEKDEGDFVKPDPTVFAAFMETWFAEHAERNCTLKTCERYRELWAYVTPHAGTTKLQKLTALQLERIFNLLLDAGGRNRKTKAPRPLSAKTVRDIAGVIRAALNTGVRWKLLRSNPMSGVVLPKVVRREKRILDADQLASFRDGVRAHGGGLYEYVALLSSTGCRRGELCAATWADVDFVRRELRISKSLEQTKKGQLRLKSTKNEKPRSISLPPSAVATLRELRGRQSENRRLLGSDYRDDLNLIFCTPDGNYLKPDSVTATVCRLAKGAGLKGAGLPRYGTATEAICSRMVFRSRQ